MYIQYYSRKNILKWHLLILLEVFFFGKGGGEATHVRKKTEIFLMGIRTTCTLHTPITGQGDIVRNPGLFFVV